MAARINLLPILFGLLKAPSFGGNGMSIDIDGDGWSGIEEYRCGSDMTDSSSVPTDADFDVFAMLRMRYMTYSHTENHEPLA